MTPPKFIGLALCVCALCVGADFVGGDRNGRGPGKGFDSPYRLAIRDLAKRPRHSFDPQPHARSYVYHRPVYTAVPRRSSGPVGASSAPRPAGGIQGAICAKAWPCAQALKVARCESTFNPSAVNGVNKGLFQINMTYHAKRFGGRSPFDAQANIDVAFQIWSEQGWRPWSCRP